MRGAVLHSINSHVMSQLLPVCSVMVSCVDDHAMCSVHAVHPVYVCKVLLCMDELIMWQSTCHDPMCVSAML